MSDYPVHDEEVYRFIVNQIDSVPHLEALLLLWRSAPRQWPEGELAERIFVNAGAIKNIVRDLSKRGLIHSAGGSARVVWYDADSEIRNKLIERVDTRYRTDLVRISNLIHAKTPAALRDFSQAFKFTKD